MKKVLLIATVQSHIAQFHKPLIKILKDEGYIVHLAARNNLHEKNGLNLENVDKIFDLPFNRSPLSKSNIVTYKMLKKIIEKNNYDVIHCNTPMGGVITRVAAKHARKKEGSKVYYTAHGFHFYKGAPFINWLIYYPIEKWLSRYTDKLITITKEDYDFARKKMRTNIFYIPGVGVDNEKYYSYSEEEYMELKRKLGYSESQFIILCTGELNKNKNQKTLINAVFEVNKKIPNLKLLLAGNGPLENELRFLVKSLDMENIVEFLGYKNNLEKYVNISDIVISMSYREGLPLNIMEAMLCEKPVITSLNRGHRELVNNGINGFLIEVNDRDILKNKIIELYKNKSLRKRLGREALRYIETHTVSNVKKELKKIYEIV
ncbi:glycosyltransferase family 4 protein [Planococcus chinensis]|uniref:glycosyltransferase family 4 protein n=1 Tax=Planococcus chinensis TaxID=272917 RepID=UPI001CC79438|nr:glycosyltransferase family 4 protein [Planococcus chinensis]